MNQIWLNAVRASGSISYIAKTLSLSPVAYWPLNELSGTLADNAQGTSARDGTYSNVTLDTLDSPIAGQRAGLWNGTTSLVGSGNDAGLTIASGNLSISAWVRPSANANAAIVAKAFAVDARTNYMLRLRTLRRIDAVIGNAAGTLTIEPISANDTYNLDEWQHLALVLNASNALIYRNGVQVASASRGAGFATIYQAAANFEIGRWVSIQYFAGYMAHTAFFNYALSLAQVGELATV